MSGTLVVSRGRFKPNLNALKGKKCFFNGATAAQSKHWCRETQFWLRKRISKIFANKEQF
jgi:hypothetical protein